MDSLSTKRTWILTKNNGFQSRPRGRPLKEKGDVAIDLQRARVRRAQKAFRERKEQHVNALESKVSDLEKVVEEMSNTFMGFSDELLNSRKVNPEQIKQTMEAFLALSNRASRALNDESWASGDEQELDREGTSSSKSASSSGIELSQPGDVGALGHSSGQFRTSYSMSNTLTVGTGNLKMAELKVSDPYRNYLWGKPHNSSTDGTSALPYILAGRDSFASRLYFETISMAVRALRGEGSRDIVDSMYRYKRRYADFDHILGVTSGVLNMMLHGTSQDPKKGELQALNFSEMDAQESAMKAAIAKEVLLHGSSETEYLNTWGVERYLRDKWGLGVDSTTVRTPPRALEAQSYKFSSAAYNAMSALEYWPRNPIPFAPTIVPGFSHSEESLLGAQSLVEKIVLGAVSLGEGPRWHPSHVDNAVQAFLSDGRSRLQAPAY